MLMIYLAMDDTDNAESRGTGRLARAVAVELSRKYRVAGVTRHQLFVHESIPFTSHNSCAVIHLEGEAGVVGRVTLKKSPTPSVVLGKAVLFVEEADDGYIALKRE